MMATRDGVWLRDAYLGERDTTMAASFIRLARASITINIPPICLRAYI